MKVLRLAVGILMSLSICLVIGCGKKNDEKKVASAKESPAPSSQAPKEAPKTPASTPTKTEAGGQKGSTGGQQSAAQGAGGMGGEGMMQGPGGGQGMMQGPGGMGGQGMMQGPGGMGGQGMMQGPGGQGMMQGPGGMGGQGMMQGPGGMGGQGMMQGPGGMGGQGMMQGPGGQGMMQGPGGMARGGVKIDTQKASKPDTANAEFMKLLSQGRLEAECGEWQKASDTLAKAVAYADARDRVAKMPQGQSTQTKVYPSSTEAKELYKYVAQKATVLTLLASARKSVEEGKTSKAISEFEKALKADPSIMNERISLADLYAKSGRIGDAIDSYKYVLASPQLKKLGGDTINELRVKLAFLYLDDGRYSDAAREFKAALASNPNNPDLVKGLAYAYAESGNYAEAAKAIESAIQLDPNNTLLHYHAGFIYRYGLHDLAKAKKHYQICLSSKIDRKYRNEARRFINSLVDSTQDRVYLKNRIVNAGKIIEQAKDHVKVRMKRMLGGKLLETVKSIPSSDIDRIEKAADTLKIFNEKTAALKEGDVQGQSELAKWAEEHGLYTQATALFNKVLKADPNNEATRTYLGFSKVDGKWVKENISLSREYIDRKTKAKTPEDMRKLSRWCSKNMKLFDNLAKAEKLLARAGALEKIAAEELAAKKAAKKQQGQGMAGMGQPGMMGGEGMMQGPGGMGGQGMMQEPGGMGGQGMMQEPGAMGGQGMMRGPGGMQRQQKGKSRNKKTRGGKQRH